MQKATKPHLFRGQEEGIHLYFRWWSAGEEERGGVEGIAYFVLFVLVAGMTTL